MDAGSYYYFISNLCEPLGPINDEVALDAITPDVKLFDIVPAGISDYYIQINTQALSNYTSEGQYLLKQFESEQVYTAGINPQNSKQIIHDFMLQRDTISYAQLVATLNSFSQNQTIKGQYYRKLLNTNDRNSRYKAVTSVRLIEMEKSGVLFLSQYRSNYYRLSNEGTPHHLVDISADHLKALTHELHPINSQWTHTTKNGICGTKL